MPSKGPAVAPLPHHYAPSPSTEELVWDLQRAIDDRHIIEVVKLAKVLASRLTDYKFRHTLPLVDEFLRFGDDPSDFGL